MVDITWSKEDSNKVENGVWFRVCKHNGVWMEYDKDSIVGSLVPFSETGQILLRPLSCRAYRSEIGLNFLAMQKDFNRPTTETLDLTEKVAITAMAKHILIYWKDFTGTINDEPCEIEYKVELAKDLITYDRSFAELVRTLAGDSTRFNIDLEDAAKN